MNGVTTTTFEPNTTVNRAMVVTILYRISGSTAQYDPEGFTDVPEGKYYYYPVGWAQAYGIVNGVTETTFCPTDPVTVQQLITFLYRYATEYEYESYTLVSSTLVNNLTGSYAPSNFAKEALNWAMNCGILPSGVNSFNPRAQVTRGLCADYLHKFLTLAFGDGKVFAAKGERLSAGYISDIAESIRIMGYDSKYRSHITEKAMIFTLYNSSIVYLHAHGEASGEGKSVYLNDGQLFSYEINNDKLYPSKLIYISACYAGKIFCKDLFESGNASNVIGFTKAISASDDTDGIHYFNLRFFTYLKYGYSINDAIAEAQADDYEADQKDSGFYSIVVY